MNEGRLNVQLMEYVSEVLRQESLCGKMQVSEETGLDSVNIATEWR